MRYFSNSVSELDCPFVVDLEADGDDDLKAVMSHFIVPAVIEMYPIFLDTSILVQFRILENLVDMVVYGA